MLNVISHGTQTDLPPVLIAHGLFGSGRNWGVIAKRLSSDRQVLAVDMRNHGASLWSENHSYGALADDLAEVITAHGGKMDVLGHSMGGKAAMMLALNHPETVNRLLVADIAPVAYEHDQQPNIAAMQAVDLAAVQKRSDAEAQLAEQGIDRMLQSFFTQSLDLQNKRWRLNLEALAANMPHILSFPETDQHWDGACLFLSGGNSDYVRPEHRPTIKARFPNASFAKMPGTGHWLHAEKPREFEQVLRSFFAAPK